METCKQHKEMEKIIYKINEEKVKMNNDIQHIQEEIKKTEKDIEYLRIEIVKIKEELARLPLKVAIWTTSFVSTIVGILIAILKFKS